MYREQRMRRESDKEQGLHGEAEQAALRPVMDRLGRLAWLPIAVLFAAMAGLWTLGLRTEYESPYLVMSLNFFTGTLATLLIVWLAGRSFVVLGAPGLLMLGCGVASWGASGFVASVLVADDANLGVTISNLGAWLSALCHLAGAILLVKTTWTARRPSLWLGAGYALALGVVGLAGLATFAGWMPVFFVPGRGGTLVRHGVLGSAIAMYLVAALLLQAAQRPTASSFVKWYAFALVLIAAGLFGAMIESSRNTLLDWTSRAAQYLGGVYLLVAAFANRRESGARGITLGRAPAAARFRFGVATAIVLAAAAVRLALLEGLGMRALYVTFYPAVVLAALYGGLRAGLLAASLASLLADYLWLAPMGFGITDPADWLGLAMFLLSSAMISYIIEAMHRARSRAAAAEEHARHIFERKRTEETLRCAYEDMELRVRERTADLARLHEAVTAERQRLYDVLETLPVSVVLMSKDHHVPFANRFFRERFGESRGRTCHEYLFKRAEPCENCETFKVLQTNAPHHWEWTGPDARNYDIYDYPFTDTDGTPLILEMGIDITERKRAESSLRELNETLERRVADRAESLRESREDMARAQSVAQIGSWRLDVNRNVLTWSDENHRIFGLPRGTTLSYETFLGCVHPDDRDYVDRKWKAGLAGEPYDIEHRIIAAGTVKWVREKAYLEFGRDGGLIGGFGISQDITERKKSEEELRSLNEGLERRVSQRTRYFNVLARIREAIVRKRDRQAMLDEVCRVMTDTGGFRLAWVGLLDPETREVRPAASHGATAYLEGLRVIAADVPEGRGPIGRAIAEGRHIINLDFETSGDMAAWRERARKHGIRSSSAFPLREGDQVIGALTIYSDQPHYFTGEETGLLVAVAEDISSALDSIANERKRREAEAALLASAAEITDLYNNAPCGYHSLDRDGVIVRINDTELSWLGYARDEVVGRKKISDFYTPEGARRFNEAYPLFVQAGSIANFEFDVVRRDGTTMQVLLSSTAVRDKDGNFLSSRSTIFDITDRKKAEFEIRRLAAAVGSAADAVVITEPERGVIQYVNAAFEQITGYARTEALGRDLHVLDSGRHDRAFYEDIRAAISRDGVWRGRLISRRKDGTLYFEDCTISPVPDASGAIINFVSVRQDVTEKLRLESIAESVNDMINIGYVFAGVRHEIGNPINSAKSILVVLDRKLETIPLDRVREYVNRALAEIGRVEHVLGSLKSYSLYESVDIRTVDVAGFMKELGDLVTGDLRQKGIEISMQVEPGATHLRADPRALHQVLLNLITNAVDALDGRPDPRIEITISRIRGRASLRVSDNGKGMTEKQLGDLFKPFYTSKSHGTGLGLVIVKKMITLMHGDISIKSDAGRGTAVTITLEGAHDV